MTSAARLTLLAAGLLSACRSPAPRGRAPDEVAAILVRPTPASRAALEGAVSASLNGARVSLSDYALTGSSLLLIERLQRHGEQPRPLEEFQLVAAAGSCVLIHQNTGRRAELVAAECAPEAVPQPAPAPDTSGMTAQTSRPAAIAR
jgi:hypothetical protein